MKKIKHRPNLSLRKFPKPLFQILQTGSESVQKTISQSFCQIAFTL